jgi:hypothetical protein
VQHLGTKLEWLKVEGNGSNALDFHIAYYLGCWFTQFPTAQYFILSKDSGFDSLVRHLKKKGIRGFKEAAQQSSAMDGPRRFLMH